VEIVEAIWEKRNLNRKVVEVTISSDELSEFISSEEEIESNNEYIVVKIPTGDLNLLFGLQARGYLFTEALIRCRVNVKKFAFNPFYQRILDVTSTGLTNQSEKKSVFEEIKGQMFVTDRVSLDPMFGAELGSSRYVGMLQDELTAGAQLYSINFRGELAGFYVLREKRSGEFVANLGGIFPRFQNVGLGVAMNIFEIQSVANLGGSFVETTFSSNNRGALATHLELGYTLIEQKYVLTKHRWANEQH
jgi:hypothetical protein